MVEKPSKGAEDATAAYKLGLSAPRKPNIAALRNKSIMKLEERVQPRCGILEKLEDAKQSQPVLLVN